MKKIAIIGSGDFQTPLILKAKKLGLKVLVFSKKNNSVGEKICDAFFDVDVLDTHSILNLCKESNINGITTIASDITTNAVVYVANALNLPANSPECLNLSTNKFKMRTAFESCGIKVPKFFLLKKNSELPLSILQNMNTPLIVKPTDRAGSRGVIKVNKKAELNDAIKYAISESISKEVIIEEFIAGEEFSCECISQDGKHSCLAFTKKFTTGAPFFVETGHIQPAIIGNKDSVIKLIFKALDALKIKNGASHAEFKITPQNEIIIIEIGARMAGDCIGSSLVRLSSGIDYVKAVIDIAMGNKINVSVKNENDSFVGIKFICTKEDFNLYKDLKEKGEIIEESENIVAPDNSIIYNSSCRFGWFVIKNKDYTYLEEIINTNKEGKNGNI